MDRPVVLRKEAGIAVLTLNRPEKLNAITVPLRDALLDALSDVRADAGIGCVVLEAQGRAFCAGQDLDERAPILAGKRMDLGQALEDGINRVIAELVGLPQPTIAAVQGLAVGAGASLALACDLMLMAKAATLHFSFARLGLAPDSGASWLLPRKAGAARAALCLLSGVPITAPQALDWGLGCSVFETEHLLQGGTTQLAGTIAQHPHAATAAAKALLAQQGQSSLGEQLQLEAHAQTKCGDSVEYRDALRRFANREARTK